MGGHALLQGIILLQRSDSGLLHCRQVLYHLCPQAWTCDCGPSGAWERSCFLVPLGSRGGATAPHRLGAPGVGCRPHPLPCHQNAQELLSRPLHGQGVPAWSI